MIIGHYVHVRALQYNDTRHVSEFYANKMLNSIQQNKMFKQANKFSKGTEEKTQVYFLGG